ncbi:MAG: hypothetical protein Q8N45_11195 [Anaerolineales bacterium]|nr:hypothetical protein [Anaerolineales bacterium]
MTTKTQKEGLTSGHFQREYREWANDANKYKNIRDIRLHRTRKGIHAIRVEIRTIIQKVSGSKMAGLCVRASVVTNPARRAGSYHFLYPPARF